MSIELLIQNTAGSTLDASQIVSSVTWTTYLEDTPGKLTFEVLDVGFLYKEGSVVSFKVDSQNVFLGYVFTRKITESETISITCYDSMRYLQNKDSKVFEATTLPKLFEGICSGLGLKYKIIDNSTYSVPAVVHDNKSYYEMMKKAIDETLIGTTEWFYVRDNYGVLELCAVSQHITNLFIGDQSLLNSFSYESSIDKDTYNQIKLTQENSETSKRDVYIARDSNTIKEWGLLQYYESVNENLNEAQIKEKTDQLLKLYNRASKTLKLTCNGDLRLRAGSGFVLGIDRLKNEDIQSNQYTFITQCDHKWSGNDHTMDLTVRVLT